MSVICCHKQAGTKRSQAGTKQGECKDSFGKSSRAIEAKRWIFWKLSINTQLYKFWHFNILSRIYIIQPANRYLLKLNRTGHKIQDDFVKTYSEVYCLNWINTNRYICINQQNNKNSIFLPSLKLSSSGLV